jgi:hypothetical protein
MSRHRHKNKDDSSENTVDYPRKPDVGRFDNLKNFAYGEILAVFALTVSFNDWGANMWGIRANLSEPAIFGARVALFIVLVILMFRWIIATHYEFDMWVQWLEHPFTKQETYVALLGLPVVMGLLLAFTYNIVIISGFMTVYFLVNYWTQWLANEHFKRAIHKTRQKHFSGTKHCVLQAMEHFWFKRPQLPRIKIMMLFSSVAFSLALAGAFQKERQKLFFQLSAYAILILDIVVGEIVIASWRDRLDQDIEQAMMSKERQ